VRVNTHPTALNAATDRLDEGWGRRRAEENAAFRKRPRGIKAEGRRAIADTPAVLKTAAAILQLMRHEQRLEDGAGINCP
jgi:hypothetical protein